MFEHQRRGKMVTIGVLILLGSSCVPFHVAAMTVRYNPACVEKHMEVVRRANALYARRRYLSASRTREAAAHVAAECAAFHEFPGPGNGSEGTDLLAAGEAAYLGGDRIRAKRLVTTAKARLTALLSKPISEMTRPYIRVLIRRAEGDLHGRWSEPPAQAAQYR